MGSGPLTSWLGAVALALVSLAPDPAAAQAADRDRDALLARQVALFDSMTAAPTDLALMFEYAAVSMRLEDYEPAISTLERMLIFNPDLPRVKLELGVAYFRLGSYDVAKFYFDEVLAADPPEEVAERIAPFLGAIARRTARDVVDGFVALGPIYSTNATLGPTDREIRSEFFPGGVARLDAEDTAQDHYGVRAVAAASWSRDLGLPNGDRWVSGAVYSGVRYRDEEAGDFDALELTTGPRLSLDERAFGPKARPFLQGGFVRAAGRPLYVQGGGGVEATDTVDRDLTLFASASAQYRDFTDSEDGFDGAYGLASAGLGYALSSATSLRGAAIAEADRTRDDFRANVDIGLRGSIQHAFVPPGALGALAPEAGPWNASLFGQVSTRFFDEPDPAVDADVTRRDVDVRLGVRLLAPVRDNWAVATDLAWFERRSNLPNYELTSFEIGFAVIRSF